MGIIKMGISLLLSVSAGVCLAQVELAKVGSLSGYIGSTALDLNGVHAYLKPDPYSDLCTLAIATEAMQPQSIYIVFLVPCGGIESLVGREYVPRGSEMEFVRVSLDFESDQQSTGGHYRTRWEAAGSRMLDVAITLRLIGFDGEYVSGELVSKLPLRWLDGSLVTWSYSEQFTSTFRARVEEDLDQ